MAESSYSNASRRRKLRIPAFYPKEKTGKPSFFFIIILVLVLAFGLIMLWSASYSTGYYRHEGNSNYFIRPQMIYAALGLAAMYVVSRVDYRYLRDWVWVAYIFAMILLVVVLFMDPINDSRRWINIRGLPTLQVGEVAKFAAILALAHILELHRTRLRTLPYGVVLPLALVAPYMVLLQREPHYSAIILMAAITITMMLCGGVGVRWLSVIAAAGAGALALLLTFQPDYVAGRLEKWIPFSFDPSTMIYQTAQSVYAIGSGGLWGVGIGMSRQKHLWLPEPNNDFIFSVLCEELGFVGGCLCIGLFALLIICGIYISLNAPDMFGSLLGIGIIAQVAWQVFFNIAVTTNVVPNTGISLPFFSSGGTSLFMLLCEMGVLLSISRRTNYLKRQREEQQKAQQLRQTVAQAALQRF